MPAHLQSLMTSRYVVGFPEQRLVYLAERIAEEAADYCVVLEPGNQRYLGLLRIADVASAIGSDQRILCDLLYRDTYADVPPDAALPTVERLIRSRGAVPVVGVEGEFIGLITEQSYSAWVLKNERRKMRTLEKRLDRLTLESTPAGNDHSGDGSEVLPFAPTEELEDDAAG